MRDLDAIITTIDQLEADEDTTPRPHPGETPDEFRARMLAEFDELNADADDLDDHHWWDSATWRPAIPEPAVPDYLIDPDLIPTVMPRGGQLRVSIGGRHIGTLNPAAA